MTEARFAALVIASAAAWLTTAACSDRNGGVSEPPSDPKRQHRVIEAPAVVVRPLPPHAILADGDGPYRQGERLAEMLEQLP
ncbi:MAG: hypothetical protein AB7P03_03480, partial [Kofleriaceae bacterium]